ncbi:MAG: hypothetical protein F6K21_04295 [Symploca sp. SIO2D2]|nr:hypothetical protein [Symploca sp. SIO2D2]
MKNLLLNISLLLRETISISLGLLLLLLLFSLIRLGNYIGDHSNISRLIVDEQIERAKTIHNTDLLLIGDSSCLMGIDAPLLSHLLNKKVESLCTLGFVGPEGYSELLRKYFSRGMKSNRVILVFHGIQMKRDSSWQQWVDYIKDYEFNQNSKSKLIHNPKNNILLLLNKFLFIPLHNKWGEYYGSDYSFSSFIRRHHGTAVDPNSPLNTYIPVGSAPKSEAYRYEVNQQYEDSLEPLEQVLLEYNMHDKTMLMISPIPSSLQREQTMITRKSAIERISKRLNISDTEIIDLPSSLQARYFATNTHLAENGRNYYTRLLASYFHFHEVQN